ncbi:ECF transporter S component [Enterococcus devriesei]|uniref:ECF transporter S component n=1 Tax=Enterococcus devriesei TaxID=319970 RepID=UPI0036D36C64
MKGSPFVIVYTTGVSEIMQRKALWITQTAVLLALLIAVQAVTAGLGNTLITGSLVNLILIVAVTTGGLASGITIAVLSPIFAFIFGIGPAFPQIVFCIAIGNAVLVAIWHLVAGVTKKQTIINFLVAAVVGAVAKFGVLYLSIVQFVVPILLKMPAPKAAMVSGAFSFPQLITALVGGGLAILIVPILSKALNHQRVG